MSIKCSKCNKMSLDEYVCDNCKYPIFYYETSRKKKKFSFKKFTINKNHIITGSIVVIALSIALMAYSDYREKQQIEELTKMTIQAYGNIGIQTLDAQEQIKKSFEQMKNFRK